MTVGLSATGVARSERGSSNVEKPPVIWEEWPDGYVVYQTVSGETHFLNNVGGPLLRCLSEEEADNPTVWRCVEKVLGEPRTDALSAQVKPLFERFDELGLVRRTAPR